MKNERPVICFGWIAFCFRSLLVTSCLNFLRDVHTFVCWFIKTATTLSTIIKQNHVHFCSLSVHLCIAFECVYALYSIYIYIRNTEFSFDGEPHTVLSFHSVFSLAKGEGPSILRHQCFRWTKRNERTHLNVDGSGKIVKPDQAHILNTFAPFISFNFWTRTFRFSVLCTIVGRFWCRWVCN